MIPLMIPFDFIESSASLETQGLSHFDNYVEFHGIRWKVNGDKNFALSTEMKLFTAYPQSFNIVIHIYTVFIFFFIILIVLFNASSVVISCSIFLTPWLIEA